MRLNNYARNLGFTLIELLVVITIIAVLAAILFPVVGSALNKSRTVSSLSNLKQIHGLTMKYVIDNRGRFPQAVTSAGSGTERFWRRDVWEFNYGNFEGDIAQAMQNSTYATIMWCPIMVQKHGQEQHPGGRGSYGMNAFFNQGITRVMSMGDCRGVKEPFLMAGTPFAEPNGKFGTNEEINKSDPGATDWQSMAFVYSGGRDMGLAAFVDGRVELISRERGVELNDLIADYTVLE